MAAFRDRNGIMYFATGGAAPYPYATTSGVAPATQGGQVPYPYSQPGVVNGPPVPTPIVGVPGNPAPPPPSGVAAHGPAAPGTQAAMFGSLPYNSGVPMTNAFVANTPTSNMNFNPGQFSPGVQQSYGSLNHLQSMLMDQAKGGGPNPAAEQFKQSTNRNIAQAYALGQSGPNNAGAARNIAENVGQINQQGASDAAQQRMQQQLAAQGLLSQTGLGLYGTSGRLLTDAQKLQLEQAQGNQQAALNAQGINAQTSLGNQQYGANVVGSAINAGGAVIAKGIDAFKGNGSVDLTGPGSWGNYGDSGGGDWGGGTWAAYGGMIPARHYDEGGYVAPYLAPNYNPANYTDYAGKSEIGDPGKAGPFNTSPRLAVPSKSDQMYSELAKEGVISNSDFDRVGADTAKTVVPMIMGHLSSGGYVPGQARTTGNDYSNDTVKAMLSPGEVVLPRSVTQSPDAPDKAKEFVEAIRRQKKRSA